MLDIVMYNHGLYFYFYESTCLEVSSNGDTKKIIHLKFIIGVSIANYSFWDTPCLGNPYLTMFEASLVVAGSVQAEINHLVSGYDLPIWLLWFLVKSSRTGDRLQDTEKEWVNIPKCHRVRTFFFFGGEGCSLSTIIKYTCNSINRARNKSEALKE